MNKAIKALTIVKEDMKPSILRMVLGTLIKGGNMTQEQANHLGGLMYDGEWYFPMNGNRVLYYNMIAKKAYVLQLKYPGKLKPRELTYFNCLLHSDSTSEMTKEFLGEWNNGMYQGGRPFPSPLLPYIPVGFYNYPSLIIESCTPIVGGSLRSRNGDGFSYGHDPREQSQETIERDQERFGQAFARGVAIPRGKMDEVVTKAIKLLDL